MGNRYRNNNYSVPGTKPWMGTEPCHEEQRHVHELLGSVQIAEEEEDPHNHRFATVTGEAIPCDGDHVHDVVFRTDFYEDHFHEFRGRTCGAIKVGDRHVHFIESMTSVDDGHRHDFRAATLIEDPTGDECKDEHHHHNEDKYRR